MASAEDVKAFIETTIKATMTAMLQKMEADKLQGAKQETGRVPYERKIFDERTSGA